VWVEMSTAILVAALAQSGTSATSADHNEPEEVIWAPSLNATTVIPNSQDKTMVGSASTKMPRSLVLRKPVDDVLAVPEDKE
jgi:hypothetical protein